MRSTCPAILALLAATAMTHGTLALAAPKPAATETRRSELKEQHRELHGRLEKLNQELARSEESQASAADQLKETESAISHANRNLRELVQQRETAQAGLAELQQQSQRLENQIGAQQNQLSRLLYRQYVSGESDALQRLLSGNDANQAARDLHYLTLLSRAKADLLGELRTTLLEKQRLADAAEEKHAELRNIEIKQQQQRSALLAQQQQRQAMLARLADRIKTQRREIDTLKRDEKRLGKLIEGLARIVAKAKTAKPRKPGKTEKPARTNAHPDTDRSAQTTEAPAVANEQLPESMGYAGNFPQQKGRLHLPVRGMLVNRFGAPRPDGGPAWKGLFIRAGEGAEVRAIAPGRVVFADWLRGFGNLLIIDHGDAYLSVYGNNQSLFRQTGDTVKSGETIASVGNSGGNPESGLYFELRQQGQAIDPLKWVSLR